MKSIKRTLGLAGAGILTLAACGTAPAEGDGEGGGDGASADFKTCMVSDSGGWDDKSFNESSYDGLMNSVDEHGIDHATAESTTDSDFAPTINNMVTEGCDLVFPVAFLLAPATGTAATDAGANTPTVTVGLDGLVDGVGSYDDTHDTDVEAMGWNKESQEGAITGDLEAQSKGKAVSDEFYTAGADIVMPVAGPVGAGTLASAKEGEGRKVIWVDADGYETNASDEDAQSVILTSVMKEMTTAVE